MKAAKCISTEMYIFLIKRLEWRKLLFHFELNRYMFVTSLFFSFFFFFDKLYVISAFCAFFFISFLYTAPCSTATNEKYY